MTTSGEAGGPQEPGQSTGGSRSGSAGSGAGGPEGPGRGAARARRRAVVRRQRRGMEEKVLRHPHVFVLLASVCPSFLHSWKQGCTEVWGLPLMRPDKALKPYWHGASAVK